MQAVADALATHRTAGADATPELLGTRVDAAGRQVLVVDDVDAMSASAQEALFHAINRVRDDAAGVLVVSGNAAPRELVLDAARDDLRSRLAWGLVYRLHRLDDDEKDAALVHRADDRRFPLTPEVRRYLLTHFSRDLGSLMRMVDALDRHARENQRVVTVPLIRDFLQRNIVFPTRDEPVGQLA
jgi:DnaA family protein